jgi:hypothetical protein
MYGSMYISAPGGGPAALYLEIGFYLEVGFGRRSVKTIRDREVAPVASCAPIVACVRSTRGVLAVYISIGYLACHPIFDMCHEGSLVL